MLHQSLFRRSVSSVVAVAGLALSAAAFAAAPPAGTYKIDPVHSMAYFELNHAGGVSRFMGRFNELSGEFVVDTPEKSKVKVDIKVDSVDVKHEGLNKHLKSPDFFNAVQFPLLSFSSTAVTLNPAGEGTLAGNLTMRGVTKPVTFKMRIIGSNTGPKGDTKAGYVATTTIKRSDFGINFGIPNAAGDEVDLRINIEGVKQ